MDIVARVLALAEASREDVSSEWDARWHLGPIAERSPAERDQALAWLRQCRDELEWLHARLEDDPSRDTLVRLLAHRVAGSKRISLGAGRQVSEGLTEFAANALAARPDSEGELAGYPRYDLGPIGL